jgi:tight adherence protein B
VTKFMVAAALFLVLAAVLVSLGGREEKAVRARLMTQLGRGPVANREEARTLIARPVRRQGRLAGISDWLGLSPGLLTSRRVPLPLLLLIAGTSGGVLAWASTLMVELPFAIAIGLPASAVVLRAAYQWEVGRLREEAFKQIPDAIGLMVRAVRAGLPISEAVRSVAREMPDPTRSEFQRLIGEMGIGTPLDKSLWGIAERTGLREYAFLSVVIGLQAQTGGSLAEALENIGDLVRRRVAMAAKANALASQARASAGILVALPIFSGTAVSVMRPGYLDMLFTDPRGINLLAMAVGMLLFGMFVIRTMIRRSTME